MVNRSCHIVGAAPDRTLYVDSESADLLIAADGGYLHCEAAGLSPDLVIGDFDSLRLEELEGVSCEYVALPRAKDDTDLLAAVRVGLERGCTEFHIHCGFSTDVAHSVANLQLLSFLEGRGARGYLHTPDQVSFLVTPQRSPYHLDARVGERVSALAFGGTASGVSERGLQWELDNVTITTHDVVGVSNVVTSEDATISVEEGTLLVSVG